MSSRRPNTPPSAKHSRASSVLSQSTQQHVPQIPSSLREAHTLSRSPEEIGQDSGADTAPGSSNLSPNIYPSHPDTDPAADDDAVDAEHNGVGIASLRSRVASETTALLKKPFELATSSPHAGPCNHGTFSPQLESRPESAMSGYSGYGFGGAMPRNTRETSGSNSSMFGSFLENVGMKNGSGSNNKKKMSTTSYLAEQHGIKNKKRMYGLRTGQFPPVDIQLMWCPFVGTSPITSPSSPGYHNTDGCTSKGI